MDAGRINCTVVRRRKSIRMGMSSGVSRCRSGSESRSWCSGGKIFGLRVVVARKKLRCEFKFFGERPGWLGDFLICLWKCFGKIWG